MNDLLKELKGRISEELMARLENLPGSLTLKRIPYYRAGEHVLDKRRADFKKHLRADFLRHVGATQETALRNMYLDDETINLMKQDGKISTHDAETAFATVDHVLSLNLGGNNDFKNLMLLPQEWNETKNDLEIAQFTNAPQSEIITIVPKSEGDPVPFIPAGYARKALVS